MMMLFCSALKSSFLLRNPAQLRFLSTRNPKRAPISSQPTAAYYDDLINAAGSQRDFTTVFHLLNKRYADGFFNTKSTFKFISTDLSVIDDLLQTLPRLDDGFPRKGAYDSLITQLCRLKKTDEALRVAKEISSAGYGANNVTFHPILIVLAKTDSRDEAWTVMELMEQYGISPDMTAYNYLLMSYCYTGDLDEVARVLSMIEEKGIEADSRTYNALVLGACKKGKIEGALMILRRMIDGGVTALYATHSHILAAMCKKRYTDQAVKFVKINAGRDRGLDGESFGMLANHLINLKKFDQAKLVLNEMIERGLPITSCRLAEFQKGNFNEILPLSNEAAF